MKRISFVLIVFGVVLSSSCNKKQKTIQDKPNTVKVTLQEDTAKIVKPAPYVYGIDISKYQGDEVFSLVDSNITFIICKATEGVTYTDPEFYNNWKTITEKGFIKGAYHFYRCNDNYLDQANNYLKAISDLGITNLPPIVDFEESGIDEDLSVELTQKCLMEFLNYIETKTHRKPIIYTDINIGNSYLDNPEFAKYPLWIADYIKGDKPNLPIAWKNNKWYFWQKSGTYHIDNVVNDFDVFNGDKESLQHFIKTH